MVVNLFRSLLPHSCAIKNFSGHAALVYETLAAWARSEICVVELGALDCTFFRPLRLSLCVQGLTVSEQKPSAANCLRSKRLRCEFK